MKKILALMLALALCAGIMAGCGGSTKEPAPVDPPAGAASEPAADGGSEPAADSDKPFAGTVLKFTMTQADSLNQERVDLIAMVEEKTGIILEPNLVPEATDDQIDKTLVGLMAGDEMDIIYYATPRLKPFFNAGVLEPLDALASNAGYDMNAVFGDYLPKFNGEVYGLPAFSDIWLTMYNKTVFDNADVEYPTADGWTWEKYIETAQKLTDKDNGVYGSLMLDYNNYNYMHAIQKGKSHYTADGKSNYADPAFSEALEFFYGLGNEEKIQPSMLDFKAGNIQWDAFFAQDAEYGMFVCGGWTLQMMAEKEGYPRDWQFGVLPMPYPEGENPSTLTLPGCYAIPATSQNKDAAFAAIACIAENQYTLGYGRVPARRDLSQAEIDAYIENELINPYLEDGVTVEDIRAAWFDSGRTAYEEKIIGPADAEIDSIWVEEGQLYGQGAKDLETAMAAILERSNRAIEESGETLEGSNAA